LDLCVSRKINKVAENNTPKHKYYDSKNEKQINYLFKKLKRNNLNKEMNEKKMKLSYEEKKRRNTFTCC